MALGDLAEGAARATGLSTNACRELLSAGWRLESKLGAPVTWVGPIAARVEAVAVAPQVTVVGPDLVDQVVNARIEYDRTVDVGGVGNVATTWILLENQLDNVQYAEYIRRYQREAQRA